MTKIPFNKPFFCGKELSNLNTAVANGKLSGGGVFTNDCQKLFEKRFNFGKCLLTTSCTDALEMAAILLNIAPGDEVIMPSYTFVSTANAFVLRGAKIIFVDSRKDHPGMDEEKIEEVITPKTKAIVVVHYAGVACNMEKVRALSHKYNLPVVEDAAQAIDSYFISSSGERIPLGGIGSLATFSFHETKNISAGEGGMLVINDERFTDRAEIIWEKGTNRSAFFRGEVDKYGWVDIGSSFLPSELTAAFLLAQLEKIEVIQRKRLLIWDAYLKLFLQYGLAKFFKLPIIPEYATNNGHMFYIICPDLLFRQKLVEHLKTRGILAVFHYLSLHKSEFYKDKHDGRDLPMTNYYADRLLRLPFYYDLKLEEVGYIVKAIRDFCDK